MSREVTERRNFAAAPRIWVVIVAAFAAICGAPTSVRAADPVTAYLEDLGASDLVALRLEQLVRDATGGERASAVGRLATIYPNLLAAAEDAEDRVRLIERARAVVDAAGSVDTTELELAIARAAFRVAESVAERWRMRAATQDEVGRAREELAGVAEELEELGRRVEIDLERSRTLSSRSRGARAVAIEDRLDASVRMRREVNYLAAWVAYYRAWVGDPDVDLVVAEERFEALLQLGDRGAVPEAVDVVALEQEGYARAVLGLALCRSLSSGGGDALAWIGVLNQRGTHEAVLNQLPGWRLAILLDAGEWRNVRDELDAMIAKPDAPVDLLRMTAARALEASTDRLAGFVGRTAVAELGRRGELAILYAIVQRYGAERLGTGGFLVRYVAGISRFADVAAEHGRDVATLEPARDAWRTVATDLTAALDSPDAVDHEGAAADAARLLGWCHWYAGDPESAWPHFAAAADRLPAASAAEAMWMAVVCLDQLVLRGRDDLDEIADERARTFLDRFPGDANAPALRARRIARRPADASESDLEALLAVPRGNDRWRESRSTVAAVLARRWRADRDTAVDDGRRYLSIASELLDDPFGQPDVMVNGEPPRAMRDMVRLSLEIALDRRIMDIDRAGAALARVAAWRSAGWNPGPVGPELDCRAVQHALAIGAWQEASELLERSLDDGGGFSSSWSRTSVSLVLDAARSSSVIRARLDDSWPIAERVLAAVPNQPDRVEGVEGLRLVLAAGRIGLEQWRARRDDGAADVSLAAIEPALEAHPRDRSLLLLGARLATERLQDPLALECWRTLSDGLAAPDPNWYESRFGLATVLARALPARALQVLDQHAALEPDYGPAPWGQRLEALHERLRAAAAEQDAPAGSGDGPSDDGPSDDGTTRDRGDAGENAT